MSAPVQGFLIALAVFALFFILVTHIGVKHDRRHGHKHNWWPL